MSQMLFSEKATLIFVRLLRNLSSSLENCRDYVLDYTVYKVIKCLSMTGKPLLLKMCVTFISDSILTFCSLQRANCNCDDGFLSAVGIQPLQGNCHLHFSLKEYNETSSKEKKTAGKSFFRNMFLMELELDGHIKRLNRKGRQIQDSSKDGIRGHQI